MNIQKKSYGSLDHVFCDLKVSSRAIRVIEGCDDSPNDQQLQLRNWCYVTKAYCEQ